MTLKSIGVIFEYQTTDIQNMEDISSSLLIYGSKNSQKEKQLVTFTFDLVTKESIWVNSI